MKAASCDLPQHEPNRVHISLPEGLEVLKVQSLTEHLWRHVAPSSLSSVVDWDIDLSRLTVYNIIQKIIMKEQQLKSSIFPW